MKKVFRTVALFGSLTLLAAGLPAQVAGSSAGLAPIAKASHAGRSPIAAPSPSPLPPNAPKPGVRPRAAARTAAPAILAPSAALPAATCAAGCDLYANTGTLSVPGIPALPVWGFSLSAAAAGSIPGPTLIVNEGDSLTITLHNNLPYPAGYVIPPTGAACPDDPTCLSLDLPGVTAPAAAAAWQLPDIKGFYSGQTSTPYALGHVAPGTYIYEAGPTPHAQRQLRMGLAGLLIVRPAAYSTPGTDGLPMGGAYDGATANTTTAVFGAEAVAALNEFDPAFNNDPWGSDPIDFVSTVFTLNGHAYNPDPLAAPVGKIDVGPGNVLLLRYANLGIHDRGLTILNNRQRVLAEDSHILKNPTNVATQWVTAGQVSDAFISIDAQVPFGTHIPIFESGFHLNNDASLGLGGAMSYLDVVSGTAGSPSGPLSSVNIAPFTAGFRPTVATMPGQTGNPTWTGTQPLTFTAMITPSAGNSLTDAEWFLDGVGQPGTGYKFTDATNATCTAITGGYSCTMTAAQLNTLLLLAPPADGDHIIWAHGLDANGWGFVSGDVFTVNSTGPLVGAFTSHLSPTNSARFTDVANGASHTHIVDGLTVPCTALDVTNAVPGCPAATNTDPGYGQDVPTSDLVFLGTATASLADWVITRGEYCLVAPGSTVASCPAAGTGNVAAQLITTPGPTAGSTPVYVGPYANSTSFPAACVPNPAPPGVGAPGVGAAPGGGSIVSFCSVIPSTTLSGLAADGVYKVYFHAYEVPSTPDATFNAMPGRWGTYNETDMVTIKLDRNAPIVGGSAPVSGLPGTCAPSCFIDNNPNNGTIFSAGNLNFLDSIQVTATLDDSTRGNSNISSGEVFLTLPTVTTNPVPVAQYGSGAEMVPFSGAWDSATKVAYAYLPLAELTAYKEGYVRFWIHAKDIAGNWGTGPDWSFVDLKLDRTPPTITASSIAGAPGSCNGLATGCTVTYSATDPASVVGAVNSNIVQGEWFTGADPGQGLAVPFAIPTPYSTTITNGTFNPFAAGGTTIYFRVKDAAGNWSLTSSVLAP